MRFQLLVLFFAFNNVCAQDTVKQKLSELWWNEEIEIYTQNMKLSSIEAVGRINNQWLSTNCGPSTYRYVQNIQQPSGEDVNCYPLINHKIAKVNSRELNVILFRDPETEEDVEKVVFSYKLIDHKTKIAENNRIVIDEFLNKELKINNILLKNTLAQLVDECHDKYSITFQRDGSFVQSYDNQISCSCEINDSDFSKIQHIVYGKFDKSNHSLFGLKGRWKIQNENIYLKFESGNIFKYEFEIFDSKLRLKSLLTTVELK